MAPGPDSVAFKLCEDGARPYPGRSGLRVLVTGASGFVGARVAAHLASAGAEVVGFCRTEPPPEAEVSEWIAGDVTDLDAVRRAVAGREAVVHAAAHYGYLRSREMEMNAVNVGGTRNVIDAAVRGGVRRVLLTSSSATCGPVPGRPATERDRPPAWELNVPYKRTKLEAERLAFAAGRDGLEVVCVNPGTVLGPGDRRPTPSGKMIRDLVEGRMAAYLRGAGINVVGVDDVARGHLLALERGRTGERYILGGENLPLSTVFALALQVIGAEPPRLAVPWPIVYGAALVGDAAGRAIGREPQLLVLDQVRLARTPLYFSSAKARAELGYEPRPAAEALASAARWFAERLEPRPTGGRLRALARLRPQPPRRPAGGW